MSFDVASILSGSFQPESVELSDLEFVVEPSKNQSLGQRVARLVAAIVTRNADREITLRNIRVRRDADPNGWNWALDIQDLETHAALRGRDLEIQASGSFNGVPFSAHAQLPNLEDRTPSATTGKDLVSLQIEGLNAALTGDLKRRNGTLFLVARLTGKSSSIGDLLQTLRIARSLDGTGEISATLRGPLSHLGVEDLDVSAALTDKTNYRTEGRIADLWRFTGVDLAFDAALAASKNRQLPALAPRHIKGRLSGSLNDLKIRGLAVATGLASVNLREIGPARVDSIKLTPEGLVQFAGVHLLQGDPKSPMLNLKGQINDILRMRGIAFEGRFRLSTAGIIAGKPDVSALGVVTGAVGVSDASGHLALTKLEARAEGTSLLSLAVRMAEGGGGLAVALDVPDISPLAAALGVNTSGRWGKELGFDGAFNAQRGALTFEGGARFGATTFDGRIYAELGGQSPVVSGTVSTRDLNFDSLLLARQATKVFTGPKADEIKVEPTSKAGLKASFDVSADAIEAGAQGVAKGNAKNLQTKIVYEAGELRVGNLHLDYLGGKISADAALRFGTPARSATLDASVRHVSLERLFARLRKPAPASGPLDLDVSVSATGKDPSAMMGTMSGTVSAEILDGNLAKRTIDLAGQNVIAWALSPKGKGAHIVCAVADFNFEKGVGKARKLVMETDNVLVIGGGRLNLRDKTLDIFLTPRPLSGVTAGSVGPVEIKGPIGQPTTSVADGAATAKVLGDTIGLPLRLITGLLTGGKGNAEGHQPCALPSKKESPP